MGKTESTGCCVGAEGTKDEKDGYSIVVVQATGHHTGQAFSLPTVNAPPVGPLAAPECGGGPWVAYAWGLSPEAACNTLISLIGTQHQAG